MAGVRASFKTPVDSFPKQGDRELPVTLDFTNAGTIRDSLATEQQSGQIDMVQSVYIDNQDNAAPLILTFQDTFQRVVAQPYTQGIYPVISQGQINFTAQTAQGQRINVIFSNIQKRYTVWGAVPGVLIVPPLTNPAINLAPSAAADNVLVAAVPNTTIKVYRVMLAFGAAASVAFYSNPSAGANRLSGDFPMFAGGSITMQPTGIPWMTTLNGQSLVLLSSAAVNIGGILGYIQS